MAPIHQFFGRAAFTAGLATMAVSSIRNCASISVCQLQSLSLGQWTASGKSAHPITRLFGCAYIEHVIMWLTPHPALPPQIFAASDNGAFARAALVSMIENAQAQALVITASLALHVLSSHCKYLYGQCTQPCYLMQL